MYFIHRYRVCICIRWLVIQPIWIKKWLANKPKLELGDTDLVTDKWHYVNVPKTTIRFTM